MWPTVKEGSWIGSKDLWDLVLVLPLTPIVTLGSCFSSSLALFAHLQNEDVEIETLRALLA